MDLSGFFSVFKFSFKNKELTYIHIFVEGEEEDEMERHMLKLEKRIRGVEDVLRQEVRGKKLKFLNFFRFEKRIEEGLGLFCAT